PILFAGLGEAAEDLQPFDRQAFVEGILGEFGA
ncbi:MAG: signal recognition particle-docking protein FtsY, partial [Anaerolineae bacterium]